MRLDDLAEIVNEPGPWSLVLDWSNDIAEGKKDTWQRSDAYDSVVKATFCVSSLVNIRLNKEEIFSGKN